MNRFQTKQIIVITAAVELLLFNLIVCHIATWSLEYKKTYYFIIYEGGVIHVYFLFLPSFHSNE